MGETVHGRECPRDEQGYLQECIGQNSGGGEGEKEKLNAAIKETQSLDLTKAGKYIIGEWMEVWFEDYVKIKVRPSSHQTYQGYIDNHINPNIGDIPLPLKYLVWVRI